MKFNIIVGNPPYNAAREKCNGNTIWPDFVKKSLSLLKEDGYLCFVHPPGWRKPESDLWLPMTKNQIHYLEIRGLRDGQKMFNCSTRYDWYVLEKVSYNKPTIICDEKKIVSNIDLIKWPWLPNSNFNTISSILAKDDDEKCQVIHDSFYSTNLKHISRKKSTKYPHRIFLSKLKDGTIREIYSSKNLGHIGISKVICNGEEFIRPINDYDGIYGMNAHPFGIVISSKNEGNKIVAALDSEKFGEIIKSTKWSNFQISYKMFKYFKKDFWKEFI
jgi:hypothetical protein